MGFLGDLWEGAKSIVKPVTELISGDFMDAGTSILKGLVGQAPSALAGLGNSYLTNSMNQQNAATAYDNSLAATREASAWSADQYAKRYQTTAKDMRSAGINPIMAATGGFSVGNAPQMSSAQSFQAAPVQGVTSSAKDFADTNRSVQEAKKVVQETEKLVEETKRTMAETANTMQDTLKKRAETGLATANERNAVQNFTNLQLQAAKTAEEIRLTIEQTLEAATKAGLNAAQKWQTITNEKKIEQETKNLRQQYQLMEAELKRLKGIDDVYGNEGGRALSILREVMKALIGR